MNVSEIFYSFQGEGKYMGVPVIFLRTAGCSAHCPWCDTKETWKFPEDNGHDAKYILADIKRASPTCKTIVITGGEPTEQRDLYNIAESLKCEQYDVHLETNGCHDITRGYFTHVVCSPKEVFGYRVPKGVDELKYVINADMTIEKLNSIIPAGIRSLYAGRIWLQPMDEKDPERLKANMEHIHKLVMWDNRFRAGIQLHKIYGAQ